MTIATLMVAWLMAAPAPLQVSAVATNTHQVEDLAVTPTSTYVATRGGLEVYDAVGNRTAHFTTAHGLDSNVVHTVEVGHRIRARTPRAWCEASPGRGRFRCSPAPAYRPVLAATPIRQGRRITVEAHRGRRTYEGTARSGFWQDGESLTASDQVCTNFAAALAVHEGALVVGAFDGGLCRTEDGTHYESVRDNSGRLRMINDLLSTRDGLFVAAGEGLYVLRGEDLSRVAELEDRAVNALAADGRGGLFATSPGVLWHVADSAGEKIRSRWIVGGSTALQDVAVASDGAVWLASEDRGVLRLAGKNFRLAPVERFDAAAALPESWVMRVAPDPATPGGVLAATLRTGVHQIDTDAGAVHRVDTPDAWGLSLGPDGDRVWIGTQGGAAVRDAQGTTREIAGLPNPNVHAFARFRGCVWIATEGGLATVCD